MFLIRRMFSKQLTKESLVHEMNGILQRYTKPPFKFEVPYQQMGINEMQMVEIICLFSVKTGVWFDGEKALSLNTIDEVIKLTLEVGPTNPQDDEDHKGF